MPEDQFDTKIAIVLREDLAVWQKTNAAAFLVSGFAAAAPDLVGEDYVDGSADELDLVGIALRAERRTVDKVLDKLRPHH